jgi:hypothetical protein
MPRLCRSGACVALAVWVIAWPAPSSAQEADDGAAAVEAGASRALPVAPDVPARRPAALPALYVTFGALQALDATSTFRALEAGAREVNPVLKGVAANRGAMVALKAASFASTVYLTERLWKKNRVAAVLTMVCVNSAYAAIVAHNYRAARPAR